MPHLSEEQLVALHYGDLSARERASAEQHLAGCAGCAGRLANLRAFLEALEPPDAPEREDAYGARVWDAIRARLPERAERRWFAFPSQRWAAAGAVAALIVAAFLVGRFLQPRPQGTTAQRPPQEREQVRERILLVALGRHLEKSQMVLVELANAPSTGPVDISAEQQRAGDLVDASRLYRQTARDVGDLATAKVLDELERTLLDIAHGPSRLDQAELRRIQQRIEAQGLIFKVRVIGAKARAARSPRKRSKPENGPEQPSQPRKQT